MIEHQITYTCDQCGTKLFERHGHPVAELYNPPLRYPCIPDGWQVVQRRLLCPHHEVLVTVSALVFKEGIACTS